MECNQITYIQAQEGEIFEKRSKSADQISNEAHHGVFKSGKKHSNSDQRWGKPFRFDHWQRRNVDD